MTETIERYVSAWNELTPATVKAALEQCCATRISYTDKNMPTYTDKNTPVITGINALTDLVMLSHKKVPGRTFSVLTAPEYFEGHCYYTWGINIPGTGERVGHDYIIYNDANKIVSIVGFLPV